MRLRFIILVLILLTISISDCSYVNQFSQQQIVKGPEFEPFDGLKTTIAVLAFDNETDKGNEKFGSAIADMLISLLVRSGRFVVVERDELQHVLHEQALGQTGVITEETAVQAGQLLGVKALIIGKVLELEEETGSHKFGDNQDDNDWSFALKTTVGHVRYSYRVVNTTTGEILASDVVSATEFRPGFGIETKEFDFEDMFEFDQTIVGLANRKAINKIAKQIVAAASNIKWNGKIIKINEDGTIYFTPGIATGVQIGDLFSVHKVVSEDPDYSELHEKIAIIRVEKFVGRKVSVCKIVEGQHIAVGDKVQRIE